LLAVFVVDVKEQSDENDSGLGETKSILILKYILHGRGLYSEVISSGVPIW